MLFVHARSNSKYIVWFAYNFSAKPKTGLRQLSICFCLFVCLFVCLCLTERGRYRELVSRRERKIKLYPQKPNIVTKPSQSLRAKMIKPHDEYYTYGKSMSNIGAVTNKGKNITVFPTDDVCLTFREVLQKGSTTVTKRETGPKPPPRRKIRQYYRIKTTAEHSAPVEIRIILPPVSMTSARLKLWRWYPKAERKANDGKTLPKDTAKNII